MSSTEALLLSDNGVNKGAVEIAVSVSAAVSETSERLRGWNNRWKTDSIGWHREDVNDFLKKHGHVLIPNFETSSKYYDDDDDDDDDDNGGGDHSDHQDDDDDDDDDEDEKKKTCASKSDHDDEDGGIRIFVPLCGKTVDMAFLAKHPSVRHVVGVEGIRKALEEFAASFPELEIRNEEQEDREDGDAKNSFERFSGRGITLLKGDFFHLLPEQEEGEEGTTEKRQTEDKDEDDDDDDDAGKAKSTSTAATMTIAGGTFDAVWDRASLVAIEPSLRDDYVRVLRHVVKPGGTILLLTIDRRGGTDEAKNRGPPYSIPESTVQDLFLRGDWVESIALLEEYDEMADEKSRERWQDGLTSVYQLVFQIVTKK